VDDRMTEGAMETADHTGQPEEIKAAGDYEKMYSLLYAYRFGTIGFLELLAAFEEILHIQPPQASHRSDVA
jgi:hypothetical protein